MSRSFGGTSFTTRSPIAIAPSLIRSRPATIRSAVDFPHPDGPTRIRNSPSATWRVRSSTATTGPGYTFVTWSNATRAIALALQTLGGDAAHEVPLGEQEQDDHRQHRHDVGGRDEVPLRVVGSLEGREPELQRERVLVGEDRHERPQEVVPGPQELNHGQRRERRQRQRDDDAQQDRQARGAVDARGLLELDRQRSEELREQEDTEDVDQVRYDERAEAVEQAELLHDQERGDQHDL